MGERINPNNYNSWSDYQRAVEDQQKLREAQANFNRNDRETREKAAIRQKLEREARNSPYDYRVTDEDVDKAYDEDQANDQNLAYH